MAEEQFGQEAAPPQQAPRQREQYETVKLETVDYGTNNFIELAKKKAPNGNLFISISKGWYPANSRDKRYKAGIGFPLEAPLVEKIRNAFDAVLKD